MSLPKKEKEDSSCQGYDFELGTVVSDEKNAQQRSKDKALELLANHNIEFDPHSVEAKRVLRKIDMRIMPMCFFVYVLMMMDKNSLSFAGIMGIKQDANLTPGEFSWLGSIVYFGYLAGEVPANFFMQRFSLVKYFSGMTLFWGMIVALHAVCHNFAGLAVVRFLLGFAEVSAAPAVIYILGSWYTKSEQVSRVALWYASSGVAHILGGFFAWCIYQAPSSFRWRGLFIFYGGLTVLTGVFLFFFLAVSPTEAKWLTEDEKVIALERVRSNKTGTEVWRFNWAQLKETFVDPRFYLIFMLLVSTGLPNGGITVFGPSIISAFGFSVKETTLLSMVPGVTAVIGTVLALILAKYTSRTIAGICCVLLSCVGVTMMLAIPESNNIARYGGYILTLQFPNCIIFVVTFITAGVGGSTKKVAFGAAYQIGFTVGNMIGPQTFRESDAPNYYIAKYTMLAFLIFTVFLLGVIGLLHWYWNKKRDRQDAIDQQEGVVHETVENEEFADLTDFKVKSFRYPL